MELIFNFIDIFIHLDRYLSGMLQHFGGWTYLILFLIIFCETGLVVTPILPGDSLLFALGALSANTYMKGPLEIEWLMLILSIAAILGDTVNYSIGKYLGPKVFHYEDSRFFRKEYLIRTNEFYERHGGTTIVIARFMPIIRTFAPFVAGIGRMRYAKFLFFNVAGGVVWIVTLLLGGYYFGNIPVVKNNFTLAILVIVFLSILPGIYEYVRRRRTSTNKETYRPIPAQNE